MKDAELQCKQNFVLEVEQLHISAIYIYIYIYIERERERERERKLSGRTKKNIIECSKIVYKYEQ